jgi:hypothetical protein
MMRTTPWRLITLQCSQIGLTLLRTFTEKAPMDVQIPRAPFFVGLEGFLKISELAFQNTEALNLSQCSDLA